MEREDATVAVPLHLKPILYTSEPSAVVGAAVPAAAHAGAGLAEGRGAGGADLLAVSRQAASAAGADAAAADEPG